MHNKSFAAEIAHNVSSRIRAAILERLILCGLNGNSLLIIDVRAKVLSIKVTNPGGRLRSEE